MDQEYDNSNSGALFKPRPGDDKVSLEGKVNIDGEDKRVVLVKRVSQSTGKAYWEIYEKLGSVFRSKPSDNPKAPVIHGVVGTIDEPIKRIAGWKRENSNVEGGSFYSLAIEEPNDQGADQTSQKPQRIELDDDIPF